MKKTILTLIGLLVTVIVFGQAKKPLEIIND